MRGFKDFVLRGNLVELAVAFVMATAFTAVVTAFVAMALDLVGKLGGATDFSSYAPAGISVGAFLTALVSFLILAAVVYFLIVLPYTKARELLRIGDPDEPTAVPEDVALLTQIRDLLAERKRPPS